MYDDIANVNIESPYYNYYEIKKGDSLYKISKMFNVNTNLLAELNGLDLEDYIYPGQTLLVPKKDVSYYITKNADTIESVANTFGTSKQNIISQNKTIYLLPGQMIFYKN